jgi:porin
MTKSRLGASLCSLLPLMIGLGAPAYAADENKNPNAFDPSLKVTVEPVAAIAGRKRRGIYSAQQIELDLMLDWEKIAGAKGLTSHITLVNRTGENASIKLLGDNLFQSQAVYGGTHHKPIHLVQAYVEDDLDDGKWDLAAGRLPVGEAFASSPIYCDFMNTALCGYPHALGAKQGFSTFPNSTWGARVKFAPSKQFYVQTGAYQVRPKAGGPWGFDWGWSGTTGTYLPIEFGWEPAFGASSLPGHYKIGAAYDTSSYKDNFFDANGGSFALSGKPPRKRRGRHSYYFLADQMIALHGDGEQNGLILLGGLVHSREINSQISSFAFAGIVDQGLIKSRPKDSAGLLFAYAKISPSAIDTQAIQRRLGDPLLFDAHGVQSAEELIEARYDVAVGTHLHVMPDLQYVIRPGATRAQRNGLLGGVRLMAKF